MTLTQRIIFVLIIGVMALYTFASTRDYDALRTELAQVREIAEAARINTHVNADNLQTIKKHWPGARHEQLEFMVEVTTQKEKPR
jgi:sensor histidine kinase regulating citrate/malate metabolism